MSIVLLASFPDIFQISTTKLFLPQHLLQDIKITIHYSKRKEEGPKKCLLLYSEVHGVTSHKISISVCTIIAIRRPGWLSRYSDSLRARLSGNRVPVGGEIYRTRPDRSWGPSSLQYNGYHISFQGVKQPGRGVTTHHHVAQRLRKE